MTRINPLIQSPSGELHIGPSPDISGIARCGDRGSFVVTGAIDTSDWATAFAVLASVMVSPDRLCRKCFDPPLRVAFARYVER